MKHASLDRRALTAAGLGLLASGRALATVAQATPEASPAASLALLPADPAALGAPDVPAPTAATDPEAVSMADALAPYDSVGTDAALGAFPRVVRHAMGETTIEARPQRIVTLDPGELDAAIQLGFIPVGAAEYGAYQLPDYVTDAATEITLVGTVAEPDIEAILSLDPDLILSNKLRHEAIYETLAEIAPAVLAERPGVSFKHNLKLHAQATGAEAEGAEVVARYEARVRELNAALPTPRPSISIVQLRPDGVRYYQTANFLGVVLRDLGFPRGAQNVDGFAVDAGAEELGEHVDGELIILAVVDPGNNDLAAETLAGDLWQLLPAVQSGSVLEVDSAVWIGGVGYGGAFQVLDELAAHFGV